MAPARSFPMADVTNAVTPAAPNGTPDYNFDSVAGLDKKLTYKIDIGKGTGARILDLAYDGSAVTPAQEFALAVNNYRQSGGGGFPAVSSAPVVYNQQVEIRQLLIDWVTANHVDRPDGVRERRLEAGQQRGRHHDHVLTVTSWSARWRSRTERDPSVATQTDGVEDPAARIVSRMPNSDGQRDRRPAVRSGWR